MCQAYGLKTPHVYGTVRDGKLISNELKSMEDLTQSNYDLMVKPLDGFCGWGIFHLRCEGGKLIVKGEEISLEKLKEMVSKGRYLIQDYITNQHEGMSKLYPNAVNTLSITVAREKDDLRVMGRMGMLGAHGTDCSNWHFGGVSVNLKEDGTLKAIKDFYDSENAGTNPYTSPADANRSKGKLVMATNAEFPPYEYREGDKITGFDVDMMTAVCDKLGYELQIDDMAFESVIPAVQSGKADVGVAGLSVTPDREKNVKFSNSYTVTHLVVMVRK